MCQNNTESWRPNATHCCVMVSRVSGIYFRFVFRSKSWREASLPRAWILSSPPTMILRHTRHAQKSCLYALTVQRSPFWILIQNTAASSTSWVMTKQDLIMNMKLWSFTSTICGPRNRNWLKWAVIAIFLVLYLRCSTLCGFMWDRKVRENGTKLHLKKLFQAFVCCDVLERGQRTKTSLCWVRDWTWRMAC